MSCYNCKKDKPKITTLSSGKKPVDVCSECLEEILKELRRGNLSVMKNVGDEDLYPDSPEDEGISGDDPFNGDDYEEAGYSDMANGWD